MKCAKQAAGWGVGVVALLVIATPIAARAQAAVAAAAVESEVTKKAPSSADGDKASVQFVPMPEIGGRSYVTSLAEHAK